MSRAALRVRRVIRWLVLADAAFFAIAVVVGLLAGNAVSALRSVIFAALLGLCDIGAWDLEPAALKARLALGGIGGLLALLAPWTMMDSLKEFLSYHTPG